MDEKERFFSLLNETKAVMKRARKSKRLCKKAKKYIKKKQKLLVQRDLINGQIEEYEKQYGETIGRLA